MTNYHLFIDESGDPSLKSINHDFPIFALVGILISDEELRKLDECFKRLKLHYFGSDGVILHSREIRKYEGVFAKLFDEKIKQYFYSNLNDIMLKLDYKIIASVILKEQHLGLYGKIADDPYEIGLTFLLERALYDLEMMDSRAQIMIESRGKVEDENLATKFNQLMTRGSQKISAERFNLRYKTKLNFRKKWQNDNGLQIADLCAYPVARHILHSDEPYPPFDIIKSKLRQSNRGQVDGYGIQIFPKQ